MNRRIHLRDKCNNLMNQCSGDRDQGGYRI